jgi:predicted nuclease of restriction endonuclease-like RecB superfamily
MEKKAFKSEGLIYKTLKGSLVRSKSEVIIANLLFLSGIEYDYEKLRKCPNKNIIPDFTIITMSKKEIIWEHLGKNTDNYFENNSEKIYNYIKCGFMPGINLFFSNEQDHLSNIYGIFENVKAKVNEVGGGGNKIV